MENGAGLTPRQKQLLELTIQEPYITKTFYLTGGTALASWYLHHRESYDLDFFSPQPFDYNKIRQYYYNAQDTLNATITFEEDFGFLKIFLRYPDNERLKADFGNYTSIRINKGTLWKGLEIDSLEDIATNKLHTISEGPRTRDYIDLYYIQKKHPFSLAQLTQNAHTKFREAIDPLKLAKNFLKVVEYTDYPNMLIPFDKKKMYAFYEDLARSLRPYILK